MKVPLRSRSLMPKSYAYPLPPGGLKCVHFKKKNEIT
jgi:hypothetical protein